MTETTIFFLLEWFFVYIFVVLSGFFLLWKMSHSKLITKTENQEIDLDKSQVPKFFTMLVEGTGCFSVRGQSLHQTLISSRSLVLKEVKVLNSEKTPFTIDKIVEGEALYSFFVNNFGMYYMGIYPFIKRQISLFAWSEWDNQKDNKDSKIIIRRRKELTNFFYISTVGYAITLIDAECKGNFAVTLKISLFIRIIYPKITFFLNEDWFDRVQKLVLEKVRTKFVSPRTFTELKESTVDDGAVNTFNKLVTDLNGNDFLDAGSINNTDEDKPIVGLLQDVGISIERANLTEVNLEEDPRIKEATTVKEVASLNAEASQHDAKRIINEYKAADCVKGGINVLLVEKAANTNLVSLGGSGVFVNTDAPKKTQKGGTSNEK